jgi:hypothetical protein
LLCTSFATTVAPARAEPISAFIVQPIASTGRTVAAEIADVDGDGQAEVVTIAIRGAWPDESRTIEVRRRAADGAIAATPTWTVPLPEAATSYDVAELDGVAGAELLFLERDGVRVLSLANGDAAWRMLRVPAPPTAAIRPDERGVDRVRLARPELGAGRLLVPGLDEAWVLGARGEAIARLAIGGRANYFVPRRPGLEIGENELEIFYDVPTLHVADLDGDARADVVASNRHALRIFRQREDGSFPTAPDPELPFRLIGVEDQMRGSGSLRADLVDLDRDGRADLVLSLATGGLMRAKNQMRIHRNRDGSFDLAKPDQRYERDGGVAADEILDLDGDGRAEWLRVFVPVGLLQLAELFLQRNIDLEVAVHRPDDAGGFEPAAWLSRDMSIGFDFETLRPKGFAPTLEYDWNGDGVRDLLTSGTAPRPRSGSADRRIGSAPRTVETRSQARAGRRSATWMPTGSSISSSSTRGGPTSRSTSGGIAAPSPARRPASRRPTPTSADPSRKRAERGRSPFSGVGTLPKSGDPRGRRCLKGAAMAPEVKSPCRCGSSGNSGTTNAPGRPLTRVPCTKMTERFPPGFRLPQRPADRRTKPPRTHARAVGSDVPPLPDPAGDALPSPELARIGRRRRADRDVARRGTRRRALPNRVRIHRRSPCRAADELPLGAGGRPGAGRAPKRRPAVRRDRSRRRRRK